MANFLNTDGLSALWAKIKSKFYTKTEVDALIPENEIMVVNISWDDANQKYVADKTAQEIVEFVNDGGVAVVNSDDSNSMILCNTALSDATENYYYAGFYYAAIEDVEGGTLAYGGSVNIKHENGIEFVDIAQGNNSIPLPAGNSDGVPIMDGTASRGDSINYARADHVHPSDTNKANVVDVLSKTNTTSYTPTADYNPATKKYVDDSIPEDELFIVNISYDSVNQCYVADKTYTETGNAWSAGKLVYAKDSNGHSCIYDGECFKGIYHDEDFARRIEYYYTYNSNYELYYAEPPIVEQNWINHYYLSKYNTDSYTPTGDYNPATKKYVDDSIPENELFIVTLTVNGSTYTADKTTAQINEAVTNNKHCIAIKHNSNGITDIYNYVFGTSTYAYFFSGNRLFDGYFNVETIQYDRNGITQTIQQLPTDLIHMSDTTISSPTEGQVLAYDSASSKWINTTLSSDAFIVTIISGVSEGVTWYQKNKSFNEIATAYDAGKKCYLTHGIYLYYLTLKNNNKAVFSQVHQDDVTGNVIKSFTIDSNNDIVYKATHIYENISELNDVTILSNSLTTGQALIYGGANVGWKNADIATDLVSLTDTTITSPANGQVLSYDSTTSKWINTNALTETRVNELIAAALAQYGDGDIASYGYTDASEEEY